MLGGIILNVIETIAGQWFGDAMAKTLGAWLAAAMTGSQSTVSFSEWNVAIVTANRLGWIMGLVNLAICMVGAVFSAFRGHPAETLKAFCMAFLCWPLTAICIDVMVLLEGVITQVSTRIMQVGVTDGLESVDFENRMFKGMLSWLSGQGVVIQIFGGIIVLLGVVCLSCVMAGRELSLILLAAIAPLPVAMLGWHAARPSFMKWVRAVVGVLLMKPLTAIIIAVGLALIDSTKSADMDMWRTLIGMAAIWMACFSPKLIMPAVSFIGENVTLDMQESGSKTMKGAITTAVQVAVNTAAGLMGGAATPAGQMAGGVGQLAGGSAAGAADVAAGAKDIAKGKDPFKKRDDDSGGGGGGDTKSPQQQAPSSVPMPPPAPESRADVPSAPATGDASGPSGPPSPPAGTPPAPLPPSPSSPSGPVGAPGAPGSPGAPGGQGGDGGQGASGGQGGDGGPGGTGGQGGSGGAGGPVPVPPPAHGSPGGAGSPSGPVLA